MFRKLVTNLPFSPALVGQLGFYAKRLRKEEVTRRIGLFMTVLALIVQSFTIFIPSTSANSSHPSDLIRGGVSSRSDLLAHYDKSNDFKKILSYAGITRSELADTKKTSINSRDYGTGSGQWLSWGRVSRMSASQGETKHSIDGTTVYSRPLWRLDTTSWTKKHGSTYTALVGTSAKMGKFAILMDCGNLVTRKNPPAQRSITVCRPGVGIIKIDEEDKLSTDLPADSVECKPKNAICSDIVVVKIDRTHFNFKASSTVENGATISSYLFTVQKNNSSGEIVATKTVPSTATKAESGSIELSATGTYYVSVTVTTSLGNKTSSNCAESFSVAPPDKCEVNPALPKNDPECKPCPSNPQLWINSPECNPVIVESKTAQNLTQSLDATKTTAAASDRIEYKLTISNPGKVAASATFFEELDDVLEYATIQDGGGGTFDQTKKTLSWPTVTLAAGDTQTRTFVVTLLNEIPATARGTSEPTSYDCIMNNTFGDNVQVPVSCTTPKVVEEVVSELPHTGPRENMIFAGALLAVVSFFWARSRQLGKEVRLVRKDFSGSTV